jgi:hypothetical protein
MSNFLDPRRPTQLILVLLETGMSKLFILSYIKEKPWETLEVWSKRNLTLALFRIFSNVFAYNFYQRQLIYKDWLSFRRKSPTLFCAALILSCTFPLLRQNVWVKKVNWDVCNKVSSDALFSNDLLRSSETICSSFGRV